MKPMSQHFKLTKWPGKVQTSSDDQMGTYVKRDESFEIYTLASKNNRKALSSGHYAVNTSDNVSSFSNKMVKQKKVQELVGRLSF